MMIKLPAIEKRPLPENPAMDMAKRLSPGFNWGNSLDACARMGQPVCDLTSETAWRNPYTTREMLKAVKKAGFASLRLPVSWHNHMDRETFTIDPAWMDRVFTVLDWALEEGFLVILNTHHDIGTGICLEKEKRERSLLFMKRVWEQITAKTRDYDERLLFESMNEPRLTQHPREWDYREEDDDCRTAQESINALNRIFVDTVRKSGGQNATRFLVVPGYADALEGTMSPRFILPEDTVPDRLMLTIHSYRPVAFAFWLPNHPSTTVFDPMEESSTGKIDEIVDRLYERFVTKGVPVMVNEFGAVNKDNLSDRLAYTAYHVKKAASCGMPCFWWDNGFSPVDPDGLGIFDRNTKTFTFPEIAEVMGEYGI